MGAMAATPAPVPRPGGYPSLYRPRNARASPLYQLLEAYYEDVKAVWEERFEKKYGYWRGFVDTVVARYLDCGVSDAGFAHATKPRELHHLRVVRTSSCQVG